MNIDNENLQGLLEEFNEDFGSNGDYNLLAAIEPRFDGYDLVVYDATAIDTHLVNDTELHMYCTEYDIDVGYFEIHRVNLMKLA